MAAKWFQSDAALLEGLRRDDDRAYTQAYRENWELILRFVLKNNGTKPDAEDLYQEAFLDFSEKLRNDLTFQLSARLSTYLYSMCRYKWLEKLRKQRKAFIVDIDDPVLQGELEQLYVPVDDQEHLPADPELMQAIEQLGDPCRTVLTGFYYLNLPMDEIARRVGRKDADNAKQLKFKCMTRLKKQFLKP